MAYPKIKEECLVSSCPSPYTNLQLNLWDSRVFCKFNGRFAKKGVKEWHKHISKQNPYFLSPSPSLEHYVSEFGGREVERIKGVGKGEESRGEGEGCVRLFV